MDKEVRLKKKKKKMWEFLKPDYLMWPLFFLYFLSQEQENSIPGNAPESLTFKERQRLFSQGKEVSNKVKASRKLMELENELNTKQ